MNDNFNKKLSKIIVVAGMVGLLSSALVGSSAQQARATDGSDYGSLGSDIKAYINSNLGDIKKIREICKNKDNECLQYLQQITDNPKSNCTWDDFQNKVCGNISLEDNKKEEESTPTPTPTSTPKPTEEATPAPTPTPATTTESSSSESKSEPSSSKSSSEKQSEGEVLGTKALAPTGGAQVELAQMLMALGMGMVTPATYVLGKMKNRS